jgi:hypothetical protein
MIKVKMSMPCKSLIVLMHAITVTVNVNISD